MPISKKDVLNNVQCMTSPNPNPIGPYICVEPLYRMLGSEIIGIVVASGKSVNTVKIGNYIRFNVNFSINITYHGKHFHMLIDKHIFEDDRDFSIIENIDKILNDNNLSPVKT